MHKEKCVHKVQINNLLKTDDINIEVIQMTINRIQLTETDILEKDFKKSMRGYNEEDVDEFLDIIIKDYEAFAQEITRLKQENERFRKSVEQPKTRKQPVAPAQANYDVLKRLSNLEKEVFGHKLNDMVREDE